MHSLTKQQLVEFLGCGPRRVHLVGIGGVGMSGLARLLLQQNHRVSGSDAAPNGLADGLRKLGASVHAGHAGENLPRDAELVVFTSAVNETNPEVAAAVERNLPCVRRGLLLTALMDHRCNIAVAGTHGKTTTAAMLAHVLAHGDSAPSFCIGAHVPVLGTNAQLGAGKYFVAEACESDGTLIHFAPDYAVCLNIEAEHLDHHKTMEQLVATFAALFTSTRQAVFYCADCPQSVALAGRARMAISFGLSARADYRALDIVPTPRGSRFTVACRDQRIGVIELVIPGTQNVSNALAALAVADQLGLAFEKVAAALATYTGAQRRFQRRFDGDGLAVVDDYAHHPTEIRATIAAARTLGYRRIVAAFQPHRYTRTQALRAEFATAFAGVDRLWLTDIYAASEQPIPGVSGQTIHDAVTATGQAATYEPDLARLAARLVAEARPGDLVLVMGAGNITQVAGTVADRLAARAPAIARTQQALATELRALLPGPAQVRHNEPMAKHTSLKVGGPAEWFVTPQTEDELLRVLRFCQFYQLPVTVVGRGTNLLVRDAGISGVVVWLGGDEFQRVQVQDTRIIAQAGARLKQIVQEARRHALGGFEFLEGIPGSLGGALRMNAGAMGRQIFEVVTWLRYVSFAGQLYDADGQTIPVVYRGCPLLVNHVAVSAILQGVPASREVIDAKLKDYSARRWATQPKEPSAGCVFKNPPLGPAGRLIDELGLKGTQIGGACVSDAHANFIVNRGGATAADVLQLMRVVRDRVKQERGVELEPEVLVIGRES
jgi:UDP-N-acetylmuramate--L-alanine ligase/UDP-N-acetylenolpyruvoylglucosamine reductase